MKESRATKWVNEMSEIKVKFQGGGGNRVWMLINDEEDCELEVLEVVISSTKPAPQPNTYWKPVAEYELSGAGGKTLVIDTKKLSVIRLEV